MRKMKGLKSSLIALIVMTLMGATLPKEKHKMAIDIKDSKLTSLVDSTMATMTVEEKIGQLFMVAVWSEWQEQTLEKIY